MLPIAKMGQVLSEADALLVHLRKDRLFEITIPSKTQAYLAMGKPVIMAVEGDAADLIRRSGAGLTCQPEDPFGIAEAIRLLASMPSEKRIEMGMNGREFYLQELSVRRGVEKFERCFERLVE
jgi:glycosyltransferase involved in cell wall biosynthesis